MDLIRRTSHNAKSSGAENKSFKDVIVEVLEKENDPKAAYLDATKDAQSKGNMNSPNQVAGVRGKDEETCNKVNAVKKSKRKKGIIKLSFELVVFLCIGGCLVASLAVENLKHSVVWSLKLWKWCVLVMVIVCGMLVTEWLMNFIVLLIELNFLLKKKVLYYVHGLRKSVQSCIWLTGVLVTWICLFKDSGVKRSTTASRALYYITWTIASLLIGACFWLLKTLLLKMLATSFHVSNFFDKIQQTTLDQYILRTLSGPPLFNKLEEQSWRRKFISQISFWKKNQEKVEKAVKEIVASKAQQVKKEKEKVTLKAAGKIVISELHRRKQEKVSAWNLKMLVDMISNSRLATISSELEDSSYDEHDITSEMEAINTALEIFFHVAKKDSRYIDEDDLRRFMVEEEVVLALLHINGENTKNIDVAKTKKVNEAKTEKSDEAKSEKGDQAETQKIDYETFKEWVVKVYKDRKDLAQALNDTRTAVKQLDKLVIVILVVVVLIVWLLLTEIATTKVLLFLSSQLVVAAFMFGNTCKTIFEALIFVFIMHPFDVGDRCIIDGVQVVVEEMNILTTVFLRYDKEKIYYPNSVLLTKVISNFNRSPPEMGDSLEFYIDFMTTKQKIDDLNARIKEYIENKKEWWKPVHFLVVQEIVNVNKIKMVLFFTHTMNFQDYIEKHMRKSELVLEVKNILQSLEIKCNLLPQAINMIKPEGTTTGEHQMTTSLL